MSTKSIPLAEQRSRLERRANVIRSRLLRTIDALDERRHQVQEMGHHAKRLAVPAIASVLGFAALAAGTTFAIRAIVEHRRERRFGYRLAKALEPLRTIERPPLWKEMLRKVTLTMIGVAASELAKRGAHQLLVSGPVHHVLPTGPQPKALTNGHRPPAPSGSYVVDHSLRKLQP